LTYMRADEALSLEKDAHRARLLERVARRA
jgi:hypothetical protein